MTREEWLEARKNGIGGSDAAKVCGRSKWGTPYTVYMEKKSLTEPKEEKESFKVGNALEDMILTKYEEMMGLSLIRKPKMVFCKKNKFMFANLDGISKEKNIVVDAKTARNKDEWGREFTSEMPTDYIYQMAHYCAVMNAPEAHVIVFFKNNEKYGIYKYMRNEDFETAIIKKEKEFWEEFVLKNKVPPMRKIQEVKENFAYAEEDIAIADTEAKKKFKRLLEIEKQKKSLSAMEEALKLDLMLEIGIKKELQDEYGNKLITWGNVTAKRLDSTKLKNKKPEIYNEFLVEQSYRRFSPNYKYMEPN